MASLAPLGLTAETALSAVAATALLVTAGIAFYALGSFLLMGRHVGARERGRSFRELVREVTIAAVTQPLLPLFYFLGRRMDASFVQRGKEGIAAEGAPPRVPIVFVHGYMQNRIGFFGLARSLARAGLGPMYGFNYPGSARSRATPSASSASSRGSARRRGAPRSTSCVTRWAGSSRWR